MDEDPQFTIEQFYRYVAQERLMGGRCKKCGKLYLPPRPLCPKCFSREFEWVQISPKGKVLTYTVIHVASPRFKETVPYPVGIVQLKNGPKLPGMIKEVDFEQLKVGMPVKVEFCEPPVQRRWPQWPRYHFTPLQDR